MWSKPLGLVSFSKTPRGKLAGKEELGAGPGGTGGRDPSDGGEKLPRVPKGGVRLAVDEEVVGCGTGGGVGGNTRVRITVGLGVGVAGGSGVGGDVPKCLCLPTKAISFSTSPTVGPRISNNARAAVRQARSNTPVRYCRRRGVLSASRVGGWVTGGAATSVCLQRAQRSFSDQLKEYPHAAQVIHAAFPTRSVKERAYGKTIRNVSPIGGKSAKAFLYGEAVTGRGLLWGDNGHDRLSEVLLVRVTGFQSMPA